MQDMETIKNINKGVRDIMMPMYHELNELRDKLNSLSSGKEYRSTKVRFDDLYKQYNILGKTNSMIVKFTSKSEVEKELDRITSERERLYKEFKSLKSEYSKASSEGKSIEELNSLVNKARQITPIINCYDKLISIFDRSLSISNVESIQSEKKEVKKREVKEVTPQKKVSDFLKNPDIQIIYNNSKKIQMLKSELFKHSLSGQKAKYLNSVIYELCEQREELVTRLLGPEAISKISVIESMEDAAYSKPDIIPLESYSVSSEEFNSELSSLISSLGDLRFNEYESNTFKEFRRREEEEAKKSNKPYEDTMSQTYRKVYEMNVRRYKNLLNSVIGDDKALSGMKDDLLYSLGTYNLDGGYNAFKKKHKDGKIGGNAISKEIYSEGVTNIKDLISKLSTYASKYIKSKGGTIIVKDSEKTRSQMIDEIDNKYINLFEEIESRKRETIESRA